MAKRSLPVIRPELLDSELPQGILSASQYNKYKTCGRAYEFRYVSNLHVGSKPAMFRGQVVHAGAEFSHQYMIDHDGKAPSLEEAKAQVADHFDASSESVDDWGEEKPGTLKDLALRAYVVYHLQALPKVHPIAVEKHFAIRMGTVPIQGYIDLVDHVQGPAHGGVPDPGRLMVADLKTGASWSQADVDKDTQLTIYAIAEGIPHVRVDNIALLAKGPQLRQLDAPRTSVDERNLIEDLEDVAAHIKKGDFPMAPIDHWSCTAKWCDYWNKCRGRKL